MTNVDFNLILLSSKLKIIQIRVHLKKKKLLLIFVLVKFLTISFNMIVFML